MKKTCIIIILLFTSLCVSAQVNPRAIEVDDILFTRQGEQVGISFRVRAGREAFNSRYSAVISPVLVNGSDQTALPPMLIQGKRAAIAEERHPKSYGIGIEKEYLMVLPTEQYRTYETTIAFQPWMTGANLVFDAIVVGCRATTAQHLGVIAEQVLMSDTVKLVRVIEQAPVYVEKTTAEKQAERYSFVAPISRFEAARMNIEEGVTFNDNMPLDRGQGIGSGHAQVEEFVERNREGSLMVYYRQAQRTIEVDFRENRRSLNELIDAIRAIEQASDSQIARVVIAGFASPEGALAYNEQLAWDRAVALKQFILEYTTLDEEKVRVFNGAVDWYGLRELVAESNLRDKTQILDIIDQAPRETNGGEAGRLDRLKRLNNGVSYQFMYNYFFPELRNAAYIKVYFENTPEGR